MKLNKKNYVIGITGGVGSGKSIVLDILKNECGANVYQADRVSRTLSQKGQAAFDDIVALFGEECLMKDGNPDRGLIAHIVFEDKEKLEKLDSIIHPKVYEFLLGKARTHDGLVVFEAALPREGHFPELCDEVWFIKSSPDVRIARVMDGRGYSKEKAKEIITSQISDKEFAAVSTRIIENDGSIKDLSDAIKSALKESAEFAPEIITFENHSSKTSMPNARGSAGEVRKPELGGRADEVRKLEPGGRVGEVRKLEPGGRP